MQKPLVPLEVATPPHNRVPIRENNDQNTKHASPRLNTKFRYKTEVASLRKAGKHLDVCPLAAQRLGFTSSSALPVSSHRNVYIDLDNQLARCLCVCMFVSP